jgi:predicted GIY-YIG superfamily endonuclease
MMPSTQCCGVTADLLKRVFQHKWREHEGFTARYNCDRLVWFERHQDVQRAIAREKELKGWRRSKKIALIESGQVAHSLILPPCLLPTEESLCPIHRGFIAMSGPRVHAVHSDSISTTPRIPVA